MFNTSTQDTHGDTVCISTKSSLFPVVWEKQVYSDFIDQYVEINHMYIIILHYKLDYVTIARMDTSNLNIYISYCSRSANNYV